MGRRTELLRALWERADAGALPAGYGAISVDGAVVRARLRARKLPFFDPDAPPPRRDEVEATASEVIRQAAARAAAYGGMSGLAGAAGLPAEVSAEAVAALRLAQRLAVVWGFELDHDRGRLAVWAALAAGFDLSLPSQGPLGARLSDLPALFGAEARRPGVEGRFAGALVRRTAGWAAARWVRFVPVLASALAIPDTHARFLAIGQRMSAALARRASPAGPPAAGVRDAWVVG